MCITVDLIKSLCLALSVDFDGSQGLTPDCVDQPEQANCLLIVYARLCSHQYYWSFCCASCAKYTRDKDRRRHIRPSGHVQ